MAADFTISQPGGAGSAPLNTDLENARVGVEIQFASLSPTGNLWALADKPDASSSSLGGTTSQVATLTVDGPGEYAVSLTQGGAVRVLVVEVNRDAAGVVLDYGLVAPARTHFTAGSVTGRGVARTMERFRNAVLVGIAAAIAAGGGGANLDPAGPLALGTANATSVAIGRTAAPLTVLGSTVVLRAQGGTYEYSGDAGTSGLFADGTDITIVQPNGAIKLHPDSSVEVGAVDPVAFSSGLVSYAASGGTMRVLGRTTDDVAGTLSIEAGGAWNTAVTNLVGGKLRLRGGAGKTLGTDKFGDVELSLGRLDSASESAKFSIRYSSSGSDPFASELLSLAKGSGGGGVVMTFGLGSSSIVGATIASSGGISSSTGVQGGSLVFSSFSSQVLKGYQVPTDAAPLDVEVQGAAANGAAITNTTGGRVRIRGGAGTTSGTHKYGAVEISVGRTIADGSTAKLAVTYGTSTDPWATELLSFSRSTAGVALLSSPASIAFRATADAVDTLVVAVVSGEAKLSSTKSIRVASSAGNVVLEGSSGAGVVLSGGSLTTSFTGAAAYSGNTSAQLTSSSGPAHVVAHPANTCSLNGGFVEVRCSTSWKIQNSAASFDYDSWVFASNLQTSRWNVSGYEARKERRYFYGLVSASGDTALAGTFTPSITNGSMRIETRAMYSTASGAKGYSIRTVATFKIAAGVITQVAAVTLEGEHEDGEVAAAQNLLSGGTMRVVVNQPDATARRWEAHMDVYYCAAA